MSRVITLPWPPSVNRIWRAFGGRVILSAQARTYIAAASAALPVGRVPPPMTDRLLVWLTLNPPDKQPSGKSGGATWDIANREKIVCDVLTKQRVWLDDSQIDALVILRGQPRGAGCVEVVITPIVDGALAL